MPAKKASAESFAGFGEAAHKGTRKTADADPGAPCCDRKCCGCCQTLNFCTPDPDVKEHESACGSFWCNRTVLQIFRCITSVALLVLYCLIAYYTGERAAHNRTHFEREHALPGCVPVVKFCVPRRAAY